MIPIGAGIVQGIVATILFIPSVVTKNLNMQMLTIGVKTNGTKKTGFMIIGAPNKIGSLTENVTGMNDALPTALFCFDLAKSKKMKAKTNVDPVPPMFIT